MQGGCLYFTDKHGVVAVGNLTHELTFHGANRIAENGQTQLPQAEGGCIKAATSSRT